MKQMIFLCVLALALHAGFVAGVDEPDPGLDTRGEVDYSVLPLDRNRLRDLNERQRVLAENAVRDCLGADTGLSGDELRDELLENECVDRSVRRELELTGDPQLSAFNYALPWDARYDRRRSELDWLDRVESRIARSEPLEWRPGQREPPKGQPRD